MKRLLFRILLGILALLLLVFITVTILLLIPVPDPPKTNTTEIPILIAGGLIVDSEKDTILRQSVLIKNGRIAEVGHSDSISVPNNAKIVDAAGRYLIPGLWDMHIHLVPQFAEQMSLPLFFANGVTNVRELGGIPYEQKKALDQKIRDNQLMGPRIQAASGKVIAMLKSEDQAREIVKEFPGDSPDFIKIYNTKFPKDYFFLLEEAQKKSIPVLGHKPRAISAVEAAEAGQKSFEHARLFLIECYPGAVEFRQAYQDMFSGKRKGSWLENPKELQEMIDTHSDSLFAELTSVMVENETWFCPTHVTRKMDAYADDPDYRNDPRLKYIHFTQQEGWTKDADRMVERDSSPEGRKTYRDFHKKGLELTGKAHRAGVKILAGTDANDTYVFPGSSLHDELQELVNAGLSPAEALKSATMLPAEYFNLTDSYGSISQGKVADIIVLDANPLTDISNIQEINSIIFNGNLYDRQKLDRTLDYVENLASSWSIAMHIGWRNIRK